jgi:O-Antigen ligase
VSRSDPIDGARPLLPDSAALIPALGVGVPAALVFLAPTLASGANGSYFPTQWGWSAIGLLLVVGTALVVRASVALGPWEWTMLGGLVAFAGWVALSTVWSVSSAQPVLETERNLVYVAAVAALFCVGSRRSFPWIVGALLAAIYSVAMYPLATRLFPGRLVAYPSSIGYQLATPFGYWNALGVFVAMGVLLAIGFAAHGRTAALRAASAAALVPLACTLYLTFSRGAWLALAAAAIVLLALDLERLRVGVIILALTPAPALGIVLASRSDALTHQGATLAAAARDGHRIALALVALTLVQAAVSLTLHGVARRVALDRRVGLAAVALLVALGGVGGAVAVTRAGGPAKLVGNAYDAFVSPERPTGQDLNSRLVNLSGSGRADYWRVAWREFTENPVLGGGAGSYERYWVRDRPNAFFARNAHNLYLEVLGELGPIGLLLLCVALGTPLVAAVRLRRRPLVAAAAAAYVAFLLHAAIDWDWQMGGLTMTALLCGGAVAVAARPERPDQPARTLTAPGRAAGLALVVPLVAFAFVLQVGNAAIAGATRAADRGDAARATAQASRAKTWNPWSYQPWELLGEVQLSRGDASAARQSFRRAIAKDHAAWTLWLDLAKASKGRARRQALARAAALAPRSPEIAELRHSSPQP